MSVLLVAHDLAPSQALSLVADKLEGVLGGVAAHIANGGAPLSEECIQNIISEAANTAIVLTGMSSSPELAAEEIAASRTARERILESRAKGLKPPVHYGFYADTDTVSAHPWFEPVRDEVSFVFVPNEDELNAATPLFPKARVVFSGNPMEEGFAFPPISREESREKLGISAGTTMVLVPFGKKENVNMEHALGVCSALETLPASTRPHVVVGLHPGDQNGGEAYRHLKEKKVPVALAAKPGSNLAGVADILMSSDELVPGADIVVQSASTVGKTAGYQKKPVINYFTEAAYERNPALREWPPVARGVEEKAESVGELAEQIQKLTTPEGFAEMLARQNALYRAPSKPGETVRIITRTLYELYEIDGV